MALSLQEISDRIEIEDLLQRYTAAIDAKDWDLLGSVFTPDATLDYTLFSVKNFPLVKPFGYLSLDVRDPQPGEQLYIPQHPGGDPTVIATGSG